MDGRKVGKHKDVGDLQGAPATLFAEGGSISIVGGTEGEETFTFSDAYRGVHECHTLRPVASNEWRSGSPKGKKRYQLKPIAKRSRGMLCGEMRGVIPVRRCDVSCGYCVGFLQR